MLKLKESTKNHSNQLERWLNYEYIDGSKGIDLLKDVTFVNGSKKADIGISWHGAPVEDIEPKKCILMKNEPPIYNCFFGKRLNDPLYTNGFLTVMASNKTPPYDYYYNIPRFEFKLVKEYFDINKNEFLCTMLRNKKWSYLRNSIDLRNREFNKQSLLKFRMKADIYFSIRFDSKYDSFGGPWASGTYAGKIPGDGVSLYKHMCHYKFSFAPENSRFNGYVTEKPIQAMCCGCIPIYYGAPDVEEYLPKGTFIDCDTHRNYAYLCNYIESMDENEYNEYIKNIRRFVTTDESKKFSSVEFAKGFKKVLDEVVV